MNDRTIWIGSCLTAVLLAEMAVGQDVGKRQSELARRIKDSGRIVLLDEHVSGAADRATARQNITDTAQGRPASRSSYGNAPGGRVELDDAMLEGLLKVSESYSVRVTELAGGSHSERSRHYAGLAFDV